MSPRPDRRPDSRPERAGRRPGGTPPGRGAARPGAPFRPPGARRPRWGASEADGGGERGRFRRESSPSQGEWSPREKPGESGAPRRIDGPRPEGRRPELGRPEAGRPGAPRGDRRLERRPERTPRFERRSPEGRPSAGAPPRPIPAGSRRLEIHSTGARPGAAPFRTAGASRPPGRRDGSRPAPAPAAAAPQGEHFAAAAPEDLIWGRHAVQAVLESDRPVHRIWCTPEMRFSPRFLQLLREAKAAGVLVEEVTWARLGQISGGAVHQGIVLQPAAAATLDLASLIEGCAAIGEAPLLIALDGLTDPQNLGAIVRSAEALGAHGLVLPQRRSAGLTGSVAKVAAGALEHLPVARVVNLNRSLDALRQEGYRVIGLASEGSVTLEEADLEGPLVVVTGSEGDGLSLLTRKHCDQLVRIPLRGTTPSLNASVATALLLYEIARRSWMEGLRGSSPAPRLQRPAVPRDLPEESGAAAAPAESASAKAFVSGGLKPERGPLDRGGIDPGDDRQGGDRHHADQWAQALDAKDQQTGDQRTGDQRTNARKADALQAEALRAGDLKAKDLEAKDLDANPLKTNPLKTNSLKTNGLPAGDLPSENLEAVVQPAVAIAPPLEIADQAVAPSAVSADGSKEEPTAGETDRGIAPPSGNASLAAEALPQAASSVPHASWSDANEAVMAATSALTASALTADPDPDEDLDEQTLATASPREQAVTLAAPQGEAGPDRSGAFSAPRLEPSSNFSAYHTDGEIASFAGDIRL